MKCPNCQKEFTSEKIYAIHTQKCVVVKQDKQVDDTKAKKPKEEKTTRRKQTNQRDGK
ncbi:hypothetical protein BV455_02947 [Parageobacillus caldoxylosilyticus]|uniref:hypothetical protein n=1 Tax=Saccharococcus caldoxylosilyticus TaxID=81408 RepID=UPI001C4E24A6|nr:hypothetical protein [Parageobacillus caldoxylosilyticus]QXJ39581.1 hypothetical protein BV455_02947 [Parageobacillus caldoxylosilyticus]